MFDSSVSLNDYFTISGLIRRAAETREDPASARPRPAPGPGRSCFAWD